MSIIVTKRPFDRVWSGNPCRYELYSATAAADATIFFEVKIYFKYIGGAYGELVTLPYNPVAGKIAVDVKDILDSKLEHGLPEFDPDETKVWHGDKQTGLFYLAFREITTASPDPSWDTSESDYARLAVKGGISYFKWRGNNYWSNYFENNHPFFTWQKNGRLASMNESMYLAWLNWTDAAAADLRLKITQTQKDGTVYGPYYIVLTGAAKNVVQYLPVGAFQLATLVGADINYKWEVQVFDFTGDEVAVSELFVYYLDNRKDYNETNLHYRNSLGGLDSVMVRGVIEQHLDYDSDVQERTYEDNYFEGHFLTPKKVISNSRERISWKGDIGHLTKTEQDRLRDVHVKRETWWAKESKWWPVLDTTPSFKHRSSTDQRWSMPFEWSLATDGEQHYTPDDIDLGDGVSEGNICLAYLSPITIDVDMSGADAVITITPTEVDPDNASLQFTYQVIGVDLAPILVNVADIPIVRVLPKEVLYNIEFRSLCANGYYGIYTHKKANTITDGGGGGGELNSVLFNDTSLSSASISLEKTTFPNATLIGFTPISAHELIDFHCDDYVGVDIEVAITDFTPSSAKLESNGNTYWATITPHHAIWSGVDITNGMTITLN